MRLLWIGIVGLVTTACSLSFNPDLPSADESDGGFFGGNNDEEGIVGGDGDGGLDASPDGPEGGGEPPPAEMGGASHTCVALAGAGGVPSGCEGQP